MKLRERKNKMIFKELKLDNGIVDATNCYIIQDGKTKEMMIVDPGGEPEKIMNMVSVLKGKVKIIYLTHCHVDHMQYAEEIAKNTNAKLFIGFYDLEGLKNPDINLSITTLGEEITIDDALRVNDNDIIHVGSIELKVINTPGHTIGSTSLYCEEAGFVIAGDTLFRGGCGRTDLPTSSINDIMNSIVTRLMILPDETIVYPGHSKSTKIGDEKPIYLELKPRIEKF